MPACDEPAVWCRCYDGIILVVSLIGLSERKGRSDGDAIAIKDLGQRSPRGPTAGFKALISPGDDMSSSGQGGHAWLQRRNLGIVVQIEDCSFRHVVVAR